MSTTRLKKRAAEDGSLQDNNLNESFVQYGTALPSLASTKKDQGEYVPVWKQEVRDEQGRRRLHGAFTGGFSAGYYNTVGSKEGWAPSTFVSKKEAKGKQREQRPEDFMDEEDLAELKAAKSYTTSEGYGAGRSRPEDAFAGLGSSAGPSRQPASSQDPGYAAAVANSLKDLVKPGSRRIGHKIMTKMGWRPGQGVGPRISYARRQQQMRELGLPVEDDAEDEEAKKHTFAPVDREIMLFDVKDNQRGLGYVPGTALHRQASEIASSGPQSYTVPVSHAARFGSDTRRNDPSAQTHMPTGGAFGISALEDADEDDDDVYGAGTSSTRALVLNDDEDDASEAFMGPGGRRKPELLGHTRRKRSPGRNSVSKSQAAAPSTGRAMFLDGTPVIPGFVIATRPQPAFNMTVPPPIPKGWQANPKAVWERECLKPASAALSGAANIHPSRKGQLNSLEASDRATILGEPVAPKSVFDYLSAKDRERLQNTSNMSVKHDASGSAKQEQASAEEVERLRVPAIDTRIAQSALKGFMPYGDDPRRQARYRAFLQHHAMPQDPTKPFAPTPLPGKTIGDLNIELDAFASAALIFKPMSGMMANRFTSGSTKATLLDVNTPTAGLRQPIPAAKPSISSESEEDKARRLQQEREAADPRRVAVREGNFGFLTRTSEPWYPVRLLCKRFNVADPHPDGPPPTDAYSEPPGFAAGGMGQSDLLNSEAMDSLLKERESSSMQNSSLDGVSVQAPDASSISAVSEDFIEKAEVAEVLSLEVQKPPMDIFKAIFASDDEDESDDEELGTSVVPPATTAPQSSIEDPSTMPDTSIFDPKPSIAEKPLTAADLATFKPTFVSRGERSKGRDESKKKDKDKKRKKKTTAVVSFDIEDGEDQVSGGRDETERTSKKRRSSTKSGEAHIDRMNGEVVKSMPEEDEWVEKQVPAIGTRQNGDAEPKAVDDKSALRKNVRVTASELF